MQNQATNDLQQQQTGLQGNSPGLQPNTAPAVSDETANVLNNYRSTNGLTVQNQGQPLPASAAQAPENNATVPFVILALIIVPICIALAVFWPQKKSRGTLAAIEPETVGLPAEEVKPQPKSKQQKGKKKQSKRKRSSKR